MTTDTEANWLRWMHEPTHWANFYNGASLRTFASLAKELWEGADVEAAVDAAVEDVCENMKRGGVPADIVAAYRDENLQHRAHLTELSQEMRELLAAPARSATRRARTAAMPKHPYLWPAQLMADTMVEGIELGITAAQAWQRAIESWQSTLLKGRAHQ